MIPVNGTGESKKRRQLSMSSIRPHQQRRESSLKSQQHCRITKSMHARANTSSTTRALLAQKSEAFTCKLSSPKTNTKNAAGCTIKVHECNNHRGGRGGRCVPKLAVRVPDDRSVVPGSVFRHNIEVVAPKKHMARILPSRTRG